MTSSYRLTYKHIRFLLVFFLKKLDMKSTKVNILFDEGLNHLAVKTIKAIDLYISTHSFKSSVTVNAHLWENLISHFDSTELYRKGIYLQPSLFADSNVSF
ncbi:hypothetical protein BGC07_17155 [Piscirickettsia litoralis]|uniref:Uncharacterized protein n=2 Tax=Piscirickettsia litoralis TaxID=1891921 RepID=A0ABX2ZXG2_9GAMM|nr:hypothetical protein BGC07_17155 [Piscirickettsia litoralis]